MPRKIRDLSYGDLLFIVDDLFHFMYAERDNEAEDENTVVIRFNPDREVSGADLVDKVNALFDIHGVLPEPVEAKPSPFGNPDDTGYRCE
jgi:hypothetical protein